jgi:hypothetical protein
LFKWIFVQVILKQEIWHHIPMFFRHSRVPDPVLFNNFVLQSHWKLKMGIVQRRSWCLIRPIHPMRPVIVKCKLGECRMQDDFSLKFAILLNFSGNSINRNWHFSCLLTGVPGKY